MLDYGVAMKRNFVYTTALSASNTAQSPPLKKYKPFEENNDLTYDDDVLDALGTQALEQFESNNNQVPCTDDQCVSNAVLTSQNCPSSSNVPSSYVSRCQPCVISCHQERNENLQLESALKQIKLLEQKVKQLQDEKYSQVGEVKILREKLNQAEARTKEVSLQQINEQSKLKLAEKEKEWAEEKKKFEERITSLASRLSFKEQDTMSAAYEKCKSEQQNKTSHKISPLVEEMRVQSAIKSTPVSARCRDAKNVQRNFKNFSTDFPTSDLVMAFSQQQDAATSNGYCNKGKLKARVPQQRHSTSTPLHSTPVVDQETQTPVDVLQHGRIEDGVTCVELNPSLSISNRKLFNHLVTTHPWLSQSCKDMVMPVNGGMVTSARDRDHTVSMEDDKGEEDKINYFVSLELPTSTSSSPFLRNPAVWQDVRQGLATMLGSPHLPTVFPEQNLLPDLGTAGIVRGDSGIRLLLVLENLVKRYCSEKTKGQEGHCRSVESWVSGSLEGLLPSFASLPEEVAHTSRDPTRMDNAQSIICVMEVLRDLICHSKPVRCHILDNYLGIPSKPPLSMGSSHCVSMDKKWTDFGNSGRITPCITDPVDDGPVAMEYDNGIKTETPDTSVNSYLKHPMPVPLACKLNAPRQAHWMTEMTLSRKVLIESSSDASVLSSVIGSYDDCNFTIGSTSFMQQGSNDQSSFAFHHSSNLFITLLHLMEPYHQCHEEEVAVISNALHILVALAQDCSEHQMECYQEPKLGAILRCILRRGRPRMCMTVANLLYHLASSQAVISGICNNSDNCPLLQAYEQLSNPPEPFTDINIEYGLKILQMVARSVCTGNKEGGKPMFIFDFDCCCSSELISGLLSFTKRMIRDCTTGREATSNISYEVISQVILVLLPVIVNQDIGDDITHSDVYKHDYTEVVKGLSTVLLQCAPSTGKWEEAVSTLKELLDYDDLQDCLNTTSISTAKNMVTD